MNLSAAVMLFEENGVRPCTVEYDPDVARNNNPCKYFKCLDSTIQKGDLVVVTTQTRHGFTIAKVTAIGFADVPVDFESHEQWGWIGEKFNRAAFDNVIETEKKLVGRVSEANANKMRHDLKTAMGLGAVDFKDVFLKPDSSLPAPEAPPAPPKPAPV